MARSLLRAGAAGFALAAALTAGVAQAQVVGAAAAVKNDVRLRKPGTPLPRPVQVRQRIAIAEQVQTGVKSQLQMLLLDKSVFTLGANARVTIDRFVYDPARGRSMGATVAKGAFRFMSGRRSGGGNSTISTPVAAIGIRGTIVDGLVGEAAALIAAEERAVGPNVDSDPPSASLIVLRGPGGAREGDATPGSITVTAGGRTVAADRPMLAIFVPGPGRAPVGPFTISPSGLMQMQALLFPAVAERLGWRQPADNLATVPPGEGPPLYRPDDRPRRQPPISYPGPGGLPDSGPPNMNLPNMPNLQPPAPQPRTPAPGPQTRISAPGQGQHNNAPTPTPTPRSTTAAPAPTPTPAPKPAPTPSPSTYSAPKTTAPPPPPPSPNQAPSTQNQPNNAKLKAAPPPPAPPSPPK